MNLSRYHDGELHAILDQALGQVFELCDEARNLSLQMSATLAPESDLYARLHGNWAVKLAEAQRWGDLIPRITAELERRAQAAKAAS